MIVFHGVLIEGANATVDISAELVALAISILIVTSTFYFRPIVSRMYRNGEAMEDGGRLEIVTENYRLTEADELGRWEARPGEYVVLRVGDSGSGIPPADLERVFEPFFTTKEIGKGSGLGLSMVYGFAKKSDGHVTIESTAGEGTTVSPTRSTRGPCGPRPGIRSDAGSRPRRRTAAGGRT